MNNCLTYTLEASAPLYYLTVYRFQARIASRLKSQAELENAPSHKVTDLFPKTVYRGTNLRHDIVAYNYSHRMPLALPTASWGTNYSSDAIIKFDGELTKIDNDALKFALLRELYMILHNNRPREARASFVTSLVASICVCFFRSSCGPIAPCVPCLVGCATDLLVTAMPHPAVKADWGAAGKATVDELRGAIRLIEAAEGANVTLFRGKATREIVQNELRRRNAATTKTSRAEKERKENLCKFFSRFSRLVPAREPITEAQIKKFS